MKREEMIKSIADNCLYYNGLTSEGLSFEELANEILTHIENLGMLPPETNIAESVTLGQGMTITSIKKKNQWDV